MTDDRALARDLAGQAGTRLLELRAQGGDPNVLRKAGDRLSHEFLTAALADLRPGDVVLSEEGADNPARLGARRVWIVDPLDGTREFGEPGRTDWAVHVALWERRDTSDAGEPLLAPSLPGGPIPPDPPWGGTTPPSPPEPVGSARWAIRRCSTSLISTVPIRNALSLSSPTSSISSTALPASSAPKSS